MARLVTGAMALCLLLAACGSESSESSGAAVGDAGETDLSVPELLDWDAPTVDGGELDARIFDGRAVAFWFWAPWCPVCNAQAPTVVEVAEDLPEGVAVVGVAGRDDAAPMQAFEREHELPFPSAVDGDGSIWARFGVRAQPTWVFVAADGSHEIVLGSVTAEELRGYLADLVPG